MKVEQPFEVPHEDDLLTRAARQKIDDDIDKLKCTIQSLKMKRNELSPISVLPIEVLSKIFIFVRDRSLKLWYFNREAPWIRVGHVCRHWRQVALGCPSLWSLPVFAKPDLAHEMMQRSKMAPLTIRSSVNTDVPRMVEELENAMAQIHRIQTIDLACFPFQNFKTMFSSLSQPAPLLEEVTLDNATHSMDDNLFSFPIDALSDAPRLCKIVFTRLNFSWESAVFRNKTLTYLRLDHSDVTSTFSQMLDALRHLPNLRNLALNDSIPSHMTSNGNEKLLEFKFLERLELRAKALDCIFLLRHIQYPPRATVEPHSSSTTVADSTTIFSLIGQNLCRTQNVEDGAPYSPVIIRSARLTSRDGDPIITFFSNVDDMNKPFYTFCPIASIRLGGYLALSQAHGPLLKSLYNCFDLSSLQELCLDWSFTYSEVHAIRDTFGKLPKLNIIKMRRSLPEICLAIAENSKDASTEILEETQTLNPRRRGESQHSSPPVNVFPALRTLTVEGVDLWQRHCPENVEHLINMLAERSGMNARIDRLSIKGCRGLRTWHQRRLGELVVDLEVEHKMVDVKELGPDDQDDEDEDEGDFPEEDYFSID